MAMPADAINTILGLGPLHLWTMRETSGSTFADEVSSGNLPLTAGSGCTPAGWGQIYGYRQNGGPGTQAPLFDGTANAFAQANGSPIGSLLNGASPYPGFAILAFMDTTQFKPTQLALYTEASAVSTDRISLQWALGQLKLVYHDDVNSMTAVPPSSNFAVFGGSAPQGPIKGGQLVGVSVDTSGNVWTYRNGLFTPTPSAITLPTSSIAWTGASLKVSVGFDPQASANSFNGALSWVCVFPFHVTPSTFYTVYTAICPEPTSGNRWSVARSGKFFPNSQLWSSKLADNAPVDPNSAGYLSQWMSYNATNSVTVASQVAVPAFDLDHTGRKPTQGVRDNFLGSLDQNVFLSTVQVPDTFESEAPQPANLGSDAISSAAQPSTGQQYDTFQTFTVAGPRSTTRSPLWPVYINSISATTGAGTLVAGTYYYSVAAVTASGKESPSVNHSYGINQSANLTSPGSMVLTMFADLRGTDPPVSYKVYRRGPYSGANTTNLNDFGLLTTFGDGSHTGGGIFTASVSATFTDSGQFGPTDLTRQPMMVFGNTATGGTWNPTVATPTVAGANTAGQKSLNILGVYSSNAGGVIGGMGVGTVITIGSGGTQETATITQVINFGLVTVQSNLQFAHAVGEPVTHLGNLWGGAGNEFEADVASRGGGGSWDWWVNAAFNPSYPLDNATVNGQSASSKPGAAGVLMAGETSSQFTGTITGGSLNVITGTGTPPTALNVGGVVAGPGIVKPTKVTAFTPGSTWSATLAASASGSVSNGRFYVGLIQHPIGWEMPTENQMSATQGRRWPAPRHDGHASLSPPLPTMEGMRFRFPAGFDETDATIVYSTNPSSAVAQMAYVVALRDYGLLIHDSGVAGGGPYLEDTPQSGREEWQGINAGANINDPVFTGFSSFTASVASGSNTLTGLPTGAAFPAAVAANAIISGPGVPLQTHVTTVNTTSGTATLSANVTSPSTGGTFYTGCMMQLQVLSAFRYGTKSSVDGTITADTTRGSTTLANLSNTSTIGEGHIVSGSGVAHDTTVLSVNANLSTAVLSAAATATAAGVTISYGRRTNHSDVGTLNTPGFQQLVPY